VITRVQASGKVTADSVASFTITFPAPPVVGNAIVIGLASVRSSATAIQSIIDNAGNTYALAANVVNANVHAAVWVCAKVLATAGPFTITVTCAGTGTYVTASAVEYGGLGSSGLVTDVFATATPVGTTAPSVGPTSPISLTSNVVEMAVLSTSAQSSITVVAASPAWTQEAEELVGSHAVGEIDARVIQAASGTVSCNWNMTTSATAAMVVVVFRDVDTISPSQVTGLTAGLVGNTVVLSWNASTDNVAVEKYLVWRNWGGLIYTSATNYNDSGLAPSTSYIYTVSAIDYAGNGQSTTSATPVTITTPPDTTPPTVPTNVAGTPLSASQIAVSWTASTDNVRVDHYEVYRGGTLVTTVQTTSLTDVGLQPSTSYQYTVVAVDGVGNKSAASPPIAVSTLADPTPPSTPTGVSGVAGATQINLTWIASVDDIGVTSYRILRNGTQVGQVSAPGFVDKGLIPSTAYIYTVVALDGAGNVSPPSVPITVTTLATDATAAAGLTARDIITAALKSIRVLGVGDTLLYEDANDAFDRLNDWLDGLALERLTIFYVTRSVVPLQSGKASYTVGVGGEISIVRPTEIEAAGLIQDRTAVPPYEQPLEIWTDQRWQGCRQKDLQSTYPQAIYYDHNWQSGIGRIYLWPVPNTSNTQLILYSPIALTEFATLDTRYTFPPGYRRFIRTNFAAEIASEYGKQLTADQVAAARHAKAQVKRGNVRPAELRVDAALIKGGDFFDWRTGEPRARRW